MNKMAVITFLVGSAGQIFKDTDDMAKTQVSRRRRIQHPRSSEFRLDGIP